MTEEPAYVNLLNQARQMAGTPTIRAIAVASGVSSSNVHAVLRGRVRPSPTTLAAIADALTAGDAETREAIHNAYGGVPSRSYIRHPSSAEIIADAIRQAGDAIAAAIREAK